MAGVSVSEPLTTNLNTGLTKSAPVEPELRYLQYLRKEKRIKPEVKACLPPLMVRSAHGKYRSTPTSGKSRACTVASKPGHTTAAAAAKSDSTSSKLRSAPVRRSSKRSCVAQTPTSETEVEEDHVFPKEVWEGPMFRIYKESPKLTMTLPRVRALRALLRLRDFETKTGFSENDFTPPDEFIYYRPLARGRRTSYISGARSDVSRLASSARIIGSAMKSRTNRLPTIDGANE